MNTYKRHRFPPDIISYAVWVYYRFNLSYRDVEDLLAAAWFDHLDVSLPLPIKLDRLNPLRARGY
jgi:putative transposase